MNTGNQCRAARALVKWSQSDLARRSKVGRSTVVRIEDDEEHRVTEANKAAVRGALEAAGVRFGGPPDHAVWLHPAPPGDDAKPEPAARSVAAQRAPLAENDR